MEKQNAHPTCKYVDGVSKCCHSSEGYWAVISCGTVYYAVQGDSTLCVFQPNAKVSLFNWNLGFSFTCQFLLSSALQNETWDFSWILCSGNSVSEKGILKESTSKMSGGGDGRGIVFSAPARTSEPRRGRCSKDNAASTAHGKDWNQIGFWSVRATETALRAFLTAELFFAPRNCWFWLKQTQMSWKT